MKKLKKLMTLLSMLTVSLLLSSCATVEIPDIKTYITLPASGDGYSISTVSSKEERIPKKEWDEIKKRGIVLLSEDWAKLKFALLKQCIALPCKQAAGKLDNLFYAIDNAFKMRYKK